MWPSSISILCFTVQSTRDAQTVVLSRSVGGQPGLVKLDVYLATLPSLPRDSMLFVIPHIGDSLRINVLQLVHK